MKKLHQFIKTNILALIDFCYPPFKKFIPLQTFRYAACGGSNTVLDIFLFFISYNYILHKQNVHLGLITLSPHIASFFMSFCITFPFGFYLSRYVIFQESELKGHVQLFRYFLVIIGCIFLNYVFLKLFVDYMGWYPTLAKVATTVFVVIFSYISQTYFSFKSKVPKSEQA